MTRTLVKGDKVIFDRPYRLGHDPYTLMPCWGEVRQVYAQGPGVARVRWADGTHSLISAADRRIVEVR